MATITTIHGDMDESRLEKRVPEPVETDTETTSVVEYWLRGELVHRSVHIAFKQGLEGLSVTPSL